MQFVKGLLLSAPLAPLLTTALVMIMGMIVGPPANADVVAVMLLLVVLAVPFGTLGALLFLAPAFALAVRIRHRLAFSIAGGAAGAAHFAAGIGFLRFKSWYLARYDAWGKADWIYDLSGWLGWLLIQQQLHKGVGLWLILPASVVAGVASGIVFRRSVAPAARPSAMSGAEIGHR